MKRFTEALRGLPEDGFEVHGPTPLDIPSSPVGRALDIPKSEAPVGPTPGASSYADRRVNRWLPPKPAASSQAPSSAASSAKRNGGLTTATPEP